MHDAPEPDPGLLAQLADALAPLAGDPPVPVSVEWSQAGTQHSGRAYRSTPAGPERLVLPDSAVAAFAALRTQMSRPAIGSWLSARASLTPGEALDFDANWDQRPYWNATGTSMLEAPAEPAVPTEDRWLVDLAKHPRDRAHLPPWLAPEAIEGEASAELRAALDGAGIPRAAVALPGEPPGPRFEGTVEVVRHSPAHFTLQVSDYGQHQLLGEFRSERQACLALWHYMTAPLPAPHRMPIAELTARAEASQPSFAQLRDRLHNVGLGGLITNLATGVPYDRIGGLDGLYFFGWSTPWEQRALPPTANAPGARQVTFVAVQPVEVQVELTPAWFGQPGGGIRFHVESGRTVRDLVREQVLALVEPST